MQSIVFSTVVYGEQLSLPTADLTAPEVKHQPNSDPLSAGVTFRMNATVTDNVGVDSVSLFYRRVGESQYLRKAMLRETQDSDDFSVTLGSKDLAAPGIELHSSH